MSTAVQVQIKEQANGEERYAERVNPAWVRLLALLEMNVRYERCVGAELFTVGWQADSGFPVRLLRSQYRAQPS